jgi:hypothetical protein
MLRDAEHKLEALSKWFKHNQLTLYVDKTCYTLFSKNKNTPNISLHLDGTEINKVVTAKYLGIYFDSTLTWNAHIDALCKIKLFKLVGPFHYTSRFINIHMARQIYYAYVYSYIQYGIELYGCAASFIIKRLQVVQHKLLNTFCKRNHRDSSTTLHRELDILKIN